MAAEEYEAALVMLHELVPAGLVEEDGTLVVYTDRAGVERVRSAFADVRVAAVTPGWEDEWRRFHVPVTIGPLWIGPPWLDAPAGRVPVVIDPGRAFGTGAHETTRMCIELLLELSVSGSLLDVGCGSGVLAIAASKLGYSPVLAVDVERAAVDATRRNARVNDVVLDVRVADALESEVPEATVVCANLAFDIVEPVAGRARCDWFIGSGYLIEDELRLGGYRHIERRVGRRFAADLFARE